MYIKRCQNFSIKKVAESQLVRRQTSKTDMEMNCRRFEHTNSTNNTMKVITIIFIWNLVHHYWINGLEVQKNPRPEEDRGEV